MSEYSSKFSRGGYLALVFSCQGERGRGWEGMFDLMNQREWGNVGVREWAGWEAEKEGERVYGWWMGECVCILYISGWEGGVECELESEKGNMCLSTFEWLSMRSSEWRERMSVWEREGEGVCGRMRRLNIAHASVYRNLFDFHLSLLTFTFIHLRVSVCVPL